MGSSEGTCSGHALRLFHLIEAMPCHAKARQDKTDLLEKFSWTSIKKQARLVTSDTVI